MGIISSCAQTEQTLQTWGLREFHLNCKSGEVQSLKASCYKTLSKYSKNKLTSIFFDP